MSRRFLTVLYEIVFRPEPAPEQGDVDDLMSLADCLYDDNQTISMSDLDTVPLPSRSPS